MQGKRCNENAKFLSPKNCLLAMDFTKIAICPDKGMVRRTPPQTSKNTKQPPGPVRACMGAFRAAQPRDRGAWMEGSPLEIAYPGDTKVNILTLTNSTGQKRRESFEDVKSPPPHDEGIRLRYRSTSCRLGTARPPTRVHLRPATAFAKAKIWSSLQPFRRP